jgi:hypothetical protein
MTKLVAVALGALILAGCGGGGEGAREQAASQAYVDMVARRTVMDSYEERLALTRGFLDAYPESRYTAAAVDAVFYYMAEKLGDTPGAVAYAEAARARVGDAETARAVDRELVGIYAKAGLPEKMSTLAERLASQGALRFDDHWHVIEGAVEAKRWGLAREYCARARAMANAQAVRASDPNREFSEEELTAEVNDRAGRLLVKDAWARANQGEVKEALVDFARADALIPRYYFDIPEYGLNVYWARTLAMEGEFDAAIERLATDALVMRNDAAAAALRDAYVGREGSESGFERFAADLHRRVARPIDDFEMPDYTGTRHRFSDLKGEVTLLALWFPT